MKPIVISAPGKIFLMGEHAVVYGKPALLATIGKRCRVILEANEQKRVHIQSLALEKDLEITEQDLGELYLESQSLKIDYLKNHDFAVLTQFRQEPLNLVQFAIIETLAYFKESLEQGIKLTIESDVPIGSGLGSSAALAVASVAALMRYLNKPWDLEALNEIAFRVEQWQHGRPSGADNTTITLGGLLWYRKESPYLTIKQSLLRSIPKAFRKNILIIQTGTPEESTGEMVQKVQTFLIENTALIQSFLIAQEVVTQTLLRAFKEADEKLFMTLIAQGHQNLCSVGVVSEKAQWLIEDIERLGGAAKICGAGGYQKASGVVLAYHPCPQILETVAAKFNYSYFRTTLGVPGVTEERNYEA